MSSPRYLLVVVTQGIAHQVERDVSAFVEHGASCQIGDTEDLDDPWICGIAPRNRNVEGLATHPILHIE